jgi:exonuclease VII small subunit
MKNENILADIKSKSLKEARDEISEILNKLEGKDVDLASSIDDYQRLIQLNKHIDFLFKRKVKEISSITKELKKNDEK